MGGGAPENTIYLSKDDKTWQDFPRKPALGSPVDEADLAITLQMQAARDGRQRREAFKDKSYSVKLMTDVIDPDFASKYPDLYRVLLDADNDGDVINTMLKHENRRLRPYDEHPTLVEPLFFSSDFSYPSGHASGMELLARLLGTIFPEAAPRLLTRAREIADSRVVAGVHYASDTEAGRALGDLLFARLEANARFRAALHEAEDKDPIATK